MSEQETIGVIGIGWVGLVTASCFAEQGHDVWAVDIDEAKVSALNRGELTMHEPGLPELVKKNAERLHFTTNMGDVLANCRLLFCCVDTPPTYSGDADLSRVQAVVSQLSDDTEHALVMKSTVPAGTGEAIRRDLPSLTYASCPEFLKVGTAVADFLNPDRVVIGVDPGDEWAADLVASIYEPLGGELVRTDVASAEMIKLASNAFLATKISFINEIANVCEEVGADVTEVARGMGLDERIGPAFLKAGLGFGGSCLVGEETVLVRRYGGSVQLMTMEELWEAANADYGTVDGEAIEPSALEVWSWVPGEEEPEWRPVSVLTRRPYAGDLIDIGTKMGRRVRVTTDHPFVVGDGQDPSILNCVLAEDLTTADWLPLARGLVPGSEAASYPLLGAIDDGHIEPHSVRVRPNADVLELVPPDAVAHSRTVGSTVRLDVARALGMSLAGAELGSTRGESFVPVELAIDERFWRVVGLYLAEGCAASVRGRLSGLVWTFHPSGETHLVNEVVDYWRSQGFEAKVNRTPTTMRVDVHSRLLASWWVATLGLGRTSYEQRIPDLAWEQSASRKQAILSGVWEGDGSWSLVNGGPSVILEFGTVSDRLADGMVRMLGEFGIVCSWRRGRTLKSTKETHWLRVSGADQIETALFLVPERDRLGVLSSIAAQKKRLRPGGYRKFPGFPAWVRVTEVTRERFEGLVYSLEVPGSHTVVASGGLICHQCFPKDVSALKQLAGNSGYHFQLLNSVIEVNELQKRRVIGKLTKHLGSLVGRRIALLGLAFKPDTDDMREASSLVLSARLQGEGAAVAAYDPVASERAAELLPTVEICAGAEEALRGADAAILVTEWAEFAELDWASLAPLMSTPLIVDGRNFLDPAALRDAGFAYEAIGRPNGGPGSGNGAG